ncbi:MAG: formate--phosphoribosylaminoimidazolecarboxamide ligase [Acidilobaceae archaeon]
MERLTSSPSIDELLENYDYDRISIATLASHSALQIVHGAKKEGFRTVLIVEDERAWFYEQFRHLVDKFVKVRKWKDLCLLDVVKTLREENSVLVPHGSFVEYVGLDCAEQVRVPIFGLRQIFRIEADQHKKMRLLSDAGIPTPKSYRLNERFEGLVIVKLPGAKGGRGYFVESDPEAVRKKIMNLVASGSISKPEDVIIQEYVVGVTAYVHYFYSPILERLEILGADIRYESDVDGLSRIPFRLAERIFSDPTFTVVGNLPLVLRESLLVKYLEYGLKFVEATKRLSPYGIVGPFCLESVIDRDMKIKVFEFSGRIVAGTNLYVYGSPYSFLYWDEPMSMGRRIAREIRIAIQKKALEKVIT